MPHRAPGFTLVEVIVVAVILGMLASIAIPAFDGALDRARAGAVISNVHAIQQAVELYGVDNQGRYPTTLSGPGRIITPNSEFLNGTLSGQYPRTPWGAQQTADIPYSAAPLGTDEGPGITTFVAGATATFGEVGYSVNLPSRGATGSARQSAYTFYDLFGEGKQKAELVRVVNVANH